MCQLWLRTALCVVAAAFLVSCGRSGEPAAGNDAGTVAEDETPSADADRAQLGPVDFFAIYARAERRWPKLLAEAKENLEDFPIDPSKYSERRYWPSFHHLTPLEAAMLVGAASASLGKPDPFLCAIQIYEEATLESHAREVMHHFVSSGAFPADSASVACLWPHLLGGGQSSWLWELLLSRTTSLALPERELVAAYHNLTLKREIKTSIATVLRVGLDDNSYFFRDAQFVLALSDHAIAREFDTAIAAAFESARSSDKSLSRVTDAACAAVRLLFAEGHAAGFVQYMRSIKGKNAWLTRQLWSAQLIAVKVTDPLLPWHDDFSTNVDFVALDPEAVPVLSELLEYIIEALSGRLVWHPESRVWVSK